MKSNGGPLSELRVARIAVEVICILQDFHQFGWVHRDIKPGNLLLGSPGSKNEDATHVIDLGIARKFWDEAKNRHMEYEQQLGCGGGTPIFASVHAHLGRAPSRRDDLESLVYTLIFLLKGYLPWESSTDVVFDMCKIKMKTPSHVLCEHCSDEFRMFADAVFGLKFAEKPGYEEYVGWFRALCQQAPQPLPICTTNEAKRKQNDHLEQGSHVRKKARWTTQNENWIFVFALQPTNSQRSQLYFNS